MTDNNALERWINSLNESLQRHDRELAELRRRVSDNTTALATTKEKCDAAEKDITALFDALDGKVSKEDQKPPRGLLANLGLSVPPTGGAVFVIGKVAGWW